MNTSRYEFVEKIGEGGIGAVFKAYDKQLEREVAIKRVLSAEQTEDENAAENLHREARTLSTLQHPNIITVYDIGQDDKGLFVVMELLKGETIDDTIKRGALTHRDFDSVVNQTMEGLIAAHSVGLVHRDIKPSNIMLTWMPSGRFQLKILDFGLAKLSRQPSLQTMDQGNAIMGSVYFMAPEQFQRKPIDQRVDLYSIGCIYYYTLTGEYPFQGESPAEVMACHLQGMVAHIKRYREDLPNYLCNWIMRLLSKDPQGRPSSAREALALYLNKSSGLSATNATASKTTPKVGHKSPTPSIEKGAPKLNTARLVLKSSDTSSGHRPKLLTGKAPSVQSSGKTGAQNPYQKENPYKTKKQKIDPKAKKKAILITTLAIIGVALLGVIIYFVMM